MCSGYKSRAVEAGGRGDGYQRRMAPTLDGRGSGYQRRQFPQEVDNELQREDFD